MSNSYFFWHRWRYYRNWNALCCVYSIKVISLNKGITMLRLWSQDHLVLVIVKHGLREVDWPALTCVGCNKLLVNSLGYLIFFFLVGKTSVKITTVLGLGECLYSKVMCTEYISAYIRIWWQRSFAGGWWVHPELELCKLIWPLRENEAKINQKGDKCFKTNCLSLFRTRTFYY